MRQTAVEILIDMIEDYIRLIPVDIIEKAKKIEKDQIESAYNKGIVNGIDYPQSSIPLVGEQYYNKTYKYSTK
jgi:hypothetical protein